MRKSTFLLLSIFLLSLTTLTAQDIPKKNLRGLGAKVLFINYGIPNGVDSLSTTNGIELSYLHGFNNFLNLSVPFKVGVANVPGDINNHFIVSLDAVFQVKYDKGTNKIVPYIFGGGGFVNEDNSSSFEVPMGLGIHYKVGKNSIINAQGEYRMSQVSDRNNLQLGLGYIYNFVKADKDRDGVLDFDDKCPDIPGPASSDGCPDSDGDGIIDLKDDCPGQKGPKETNGCPDTDMDMIADNDDDCPDVPGLKEFNGCPDTDGDGIEDAVDQCPEKPGIPEARGCPDTDGDGLPDKDDLCPELPGPRLLSGCPDKDGDNIADKDDDCPELAGPEATMGCPDRDGDSVIDPDDRCPDEAGPESNKGCPEIKEEVKEVLEFAMRAVRFETGKATLKRESFEILDQIVDIMEEYSAYKLHISGHTDNIGDEAQNLLLSEERAKACMQYLISKGISPTRLTFAGFGETVPIGDNNSAFGRGLNRRVEFILSIE
ncbi:MAG: OmpA family protein [Bacteroidetes bacterium]|nr:MAG: OmpA family protein [Bacteroidota bacterium]